MDIPKALRTFPATPAGLVQSFVARYPPEDAELLALHEEEKAAVSD